MGEKKENNALGERLAGLLEKWNKVEQQEQIGGFIPGRVVETVFTYEDGTEYHHFANEYLAEIYVALIPFDWTPYELELEEKFERGIPLTPEETNFLRIDRKNKFNPKRVISAIILYSQIGKVPDLVLTEQKVEVAKPKPRIVSPLSLPMMDRLGGRRAD